MGKGKGAAAKNQDKRIETRRKIGDRKGETTHPKSGAESKKR